MHAYGHGMRKNPAQIAIRWIVAIAFIVLQAGAGLIPAAPGPVSQQIAVSKMADCKMCAPMPAASGTCAANFCLKANFGQEFELAAGPEKPVFAIVSTRLPVGIAASPPTRPA
jgi:hypothetical protein